MGNGPLIRPTAPTFNTGLGQQTRGEHRIERRRHGHDGQVFGADAAVLAAHVRVQRVARFGHRAAQHATVAGAHCVLVLQVSAQRVRRPVNLS